MYCPATRLICQAVVAIVAEPEMEPEQEPSGPDQDIEQAPGAPAFEHVYSVYRFWSRSWCILSLLSPVIFRCKGSTKAIKLRGLLRV